MAHEPLHLSNPEKFGLQSPRKLASGHSLYRQMKNGSEIPGELMEIAYRTTADGFGRPNDENNRRDVYNHITPDFVDLDWIVDENGLVVGFGASATFQEDGNLPLFYLGGLMLFKEAQGKRAGSEFIKARIQEERAGSIGLQTQNSYMQRAANKYGLYNVERAYDFGLAHRNSPENLIEVVETSTGKLVVERNRYINLVTGEPMCLYGDLTPEQCIEGLDCPGDAAILVIDVVNDL